MNDSYVIELFSFLDPLPRPSRLEAAGLRHLAFKVQTTKEAVNELKGKWVNIEPIRVDEHSGKRFCFFRNPDDLPLELYEYQ